MLGSFSKEKGFISLLQGLGGGMKRFRAAGLWGGSASLFTASVFARSGRNVLFICRCLEEAELFSSEFANFLPEGSLGLFPPEESGDGAGEPDFDCLRRRSAIVAGVRSSVRRLIAAPVESVLQKLPESENPGSGHVIEIKKGGVYPMAPLVRNLARKGYRREFEVHAPGEFAVRGGIIDVFPVSRGLPCRVEFEQDRVDSMREFDPGKQVSVSGIESVEIFPAVFSSRRSDETLLSLLEDAVVVLYNPGQVAGKAAEIDLFAGEVLKDGKRERYLSPGEFSGILEQRQVVHVTPFDAEPGDDSPGAEFEVLQPGCAPGSPEALAGEIAGWKKKGFDVHVFCETEGEKERLRGILSGSGGVEGEAELRLGILDRGFVIPGMKLAVLSGRDIFGRYRRRPAGFRRSSAAALDGFELDEGDYAVHLNYGIGRYRGIKQKEVSGKTGEYLVLEYLDGDILYIPPSEVHLVSKYKGVEGFSPPLYPLGGSSWKKARDSAAAAARDVAGDLLALYAGRQAAEGFSFSADNDWQAGFEDSFIYPETEGQLRAAAEVKKDMESARPMDRLVCGDSGYGKTEVAMRAAFKCVMDGKQAAVLVPTTILAEQHFTTFSERMADYPVNIAVLNRFKTASGQKKALAALETGDIDIVIGTHRLLQPDVSFRDLGLVVIDEEQRFGVSQKEKLKKYRTIVDVLTMTATPIPRTLYMSLAGIKDVSVIETPPENRTPVEGRVVPFSKKIIRAAVLRELERNCQVFYVHNRVGTIEKTAGMIKEIVPEARIGTAHGRMEPSRLARVMKKFLDRGLDLLVCTTIVESGLDIPNLNTIIIEKSEGYGLADLYQLKGRVGRGARKGYAVFMVSGSPSSGDSMKRLKAVREIASPGSGFRVAMRDLEIRGAGNLLGRQQHGHIAAVGFDLYCRLLKQAVNMLKGVEEPRLGAAVDIGSEHFIPENYIADTKSRLEAYRRLSSVMTLGELGRLREELEDRFGKIPPPLEKILRGVSLKIKAGEAGVAHIGVEPGRFRIRFYDGREIDEPLPAGSAGDGIEEIIEKRIGLAG